MQCFQILNDAVFRRCFEKNIDLNVFDALVLTRHISDVFGNKFNQNCSNSFKNCDKSIISLSGLFETQKHLVKHRTFCLTMQCFERRISIFNDAIF